MVRKYRLLLLVALVCFVAGLVGPALAAPAQSKTATPAPTASKPAKLSRSVHYHVVSQVGDIAIETSLVKTTLKVYLKSKSGGPLPVDGASGTAVVTFPDGTTQNVSLSLTTVGKLQLFTGQWQATTSPPNQAGVKITGLPGSPSDLAYTAEFPWGKHHVKGAGASSTTQTNAGSSSTNTGSTGSPGSNAPPPSPARVTR